MSLTAAVLYLQCFRTMSGLHLRAHCTPASTAESTCPGTRRLKSTKFSRNGPIMDLSDYHSKASEKLRIADLLNLIPEKGVNALDVGARDGFISKLLAERFELVTALDLELPNISHERVRCVKGDATDLQFEDSSFDLVFCAEVLEHIPSQKLEKACLELQRVTRDALIVGVPYKQDTRVGRTTCANCGRVNPPWGHVNTFDELALRELFPNCTIERQSFVGTNSDISNGFSAALLDLAGNPFGTYVQDEPCIHCGKSLGTPSKRNIVQKILTKAAFTISKAQQRLSKPHPNWIHLRLRRRT